MLSNIVVCICDLIRIVESLEACIGHVFLIFAPRNALRVEQIHDGGDVGREGVEIVVIHSKIVTSHNGGVVRLRWLRMEVSKLLMKCPSRTMEKIDSSIQMCLHGLWRSSW